MNPTDKRVEHRADPEVLAQGNPREQHHEAHEHDHDPDREIDLLGDTLVEHVPGREPEMGSNRDRDREADEEQPGHQRREAPQQLPPTREPENLRVPARRQHAARRPYRSRGEK